MISLHSPSIEPGRGFTSWEPQRSNSFSSDNGGFSRGGSHSLRLAEGSSGKEGSLCGRHLVSAVRKVELSNFIDFAPIFNQASKENTYVAKAAARETDMVAIVLDLDYSLD